MKDIINLIRLKAVVQQDQAHCTLLPDLHQTPDTYYLRVNYIFDDVYCTDNKNIQLILIMIMIFNRSHVHRHESQRKSSGTVNPERTSLNYIWTSLISEKIMLSNPITGELPLIQTSADRSQILDLIELCFQVFWN